MQGQRDTIDWFKINRRTAASPGFRDKVKAGVQRKIEEDKRFYDEAVNRASEHDHVIATKEVGRILKLSSSSITRYANKHKIGEKKYRGWRFSKAEIEQMRNRPKSAAESPGFREKVSVGLRRYFEQNPPGPRRPHTTERKERIRAAIRRKMEQDSQYRERLIESGKALARLRHGKKGRKGKNI